jgi:hypothetical protein
LKQIFEGAEQGDTRVFQPHDGGAGDNLVQHVLRDGMAEHDFGNVLNDRGFIVVIGIKPVVVGFFLLSAILFNGSGHPDGFTALFFACGDDDGFVA